MNKLKKLI